MTEQEHIKKLAEEILPHPVMENPLLPGYLFLYDIVKKKHYCLTDWLLDQLEEMGYNTEICKYGKEIYISFKDIGLSTQSAPTRIEALLRVYEWAVNNREVSNVSSP